MLLVRLAFLIAVANLCAPAAPQEAAVTFGTTVVIPAGLHGRVYHIKRNSTRLPDFRRLKPLGSIYTSSLNVPPQDFKQGFPGVTRRTEWFAIEYTGRFWINEPGRYDFALTSDDGAKLYIDDELIVDNDGMHPPEDRSGAVTLNGGVHQMRVSYFQGPRFQVALVLKVAPPGAPFRIFSTEDFRPPLHPESWPYSEPKDSSNKPSRKH